MLVVVLKSMKKQRIFKIKKILIRIVLTYVQQKPGHLVFNFTKIF